MANIIAAKDLRAGHTIFYNNNIYLIINNSFNKTAMREGIVKCKVKNLRTGSITIEVFTGLKLEQAQVDKKKMSFVYSDGENLNFMDNETYEQIFIPIKKLEWEKNFISEGIEVNIIAYEGEILGLTLPDLVTIEVEIAEDAIQGNSVTNAMKKAKLVTGFELDVPQFITSGEKIVVNTKDGTYVSRGSK